MTPVILVQALSVKKINMCYCCMCDLDTDVSMVPTLRIGNGSRRKYFDVLHAVSERKYQLFLLDTNCNKLINVYGLHARSILLCPERSRLN